ncbi:uncharacterized protein PAC_06558 [Phialocephala subalpina]|uniref:Uncharacterized protein n=1 Tax=Phialocephala subalpina TaxID=576137 RepID=A0A1L7WV80_9HELO|nr:uncharacterized protein PAC_06558 [Phialocephala subalpina]
MPRTFLLILALLNLGTALPWQGPQPTQSATSTANWTPAPTSNPNDDISFLELVRRDIYPVSVCGWIGGNVAQPAYCSTQSSCVWNSDYSIVGCCATASSNCQFYTSCIDINSPQQSGDSDQVFTCRGTSLCYSNTYPGNYKQWGCGSSDWATNIATSYSGMAKDISLQIVTTGAGSGATTTISEINSFSSSLVSQASTLATSSTPTSQGTSATEATSGSQSFAQTSATSSTPSTSASAGNTTSTSTSSKSTIPVAGIAGGVGGGIGAIALIAGLCIFGRRRGWFGKNSHRRSIQLHSNNPSTQALATHPDVPMNVPMTQVPRSHTPAHTAAVAPSAALRFDKRGVLITDESSVGSSREGPVPSGKPPGSGVKKSSKPKMSSSSGASTKSSSKPKSGSSSGTGAKKGKKPAGSSSAGGSSSK